MKKQTAMKLIIILQFGNNKYIFIVSLRDSSFERLMEKNEVSFIV